MSQELLKETVLIFHPMRGSIMTKRFGSSHQGSAAFLVRTRLGSAVVGIIIFWKGLLPSEDGRNSTNSVSGKDLGAVNLEIFVVVAAVVGVFLQSHTRACGVYWLREGPTFRLVIRL